MHSVKSWPEGPDRHFSGAESALIWKGSMAPRGNSTVWTPPESRPSSEYPLVRHHRSKRATAARRAGVAAV